MTIDIASYLTEIERLMGVALEESKKNLGSVDQIRAEDQLNILLSGAYTAAKRFEMEIYNDIMQREHTCYDYKSNEMDLLSLAIILSAWAAWLFKSKSEDPKREQSLRKQAEAVSKYVESMTTNAIRGAQNIGINGGRPEGKSEPIRIV